MAEIIWVVKAFDEISTAELYNILKARMEVFIIEQECHYLDLDEYDKMALHLWCENEGQILAYCRIFDQQIKYNEASIGRVLTTQSARGAGWGRQLVQYAVDIIENRYKTPWIRISAQDYLIPFYSSFGFVDTGKKYLEDTLPHTEMLRK